jgi:hypothetical protein
MNNSRTTQIGSNQPTSRGVLSTGRPHLIETARELRHFVRGKPQSVRDAAHNIIAGFRSVAAGRAEPDTEYRMIAEHVEQLSVQHGRGWLRPTRL